MMPYVILMNNKLRILLLYHNNIIGFIPETMFTISQSLNLLDLANNQSSYFS